jgi:hypothetical protein
MIIFLSTVFHQFIYTLILPGLLLGIGAIILSLFLPNFAYKKPVFITGVVAIVFFTFFSGKYISETKWKAKWQLHETQQALEIAKLEAAAAYITTETVVMYVDKVKVVEKLKTEYRTVYVDKYITTEIDNQYGFLPDTFIMLHDSAAKGLVPDTTRSADEITTEASGIKLSTATKVIVDNYLTCTATELQLLSLQKWVRDQQRLHDGGLDAGKNHR